MKKIPLTQGKFAIVDDENFEQLSKHKWCVQKAENTFYAIRGIGGRLNHRVISMHRQILGLKHGDGKQTDHKNHNGLDNREANLRVCINTQNQHNRLKAKNKRTSQYKGIYWHKGRIYKGKQYKGRWQVEIQFNKKRIYLGSFHNEIKAAKMYDKKAKVLFGEFANLNFN